MVSKNSVLLVLGALVLAVLGVNFSILFGLQGKLDQLQNTSSLLALSASNTGGSSSVKGSALQQSGETNTEALFAEVIPRGVPQGYGNELGVSFESPVESLETLRLLDGDLYPNGKYKFEQLMDSQKQRYIQIGQSISCEFCCGAQYIVAKDGKPACGCAHSAAMRGLAMHLLSNNENEYSNEQILLELTKWKTMFFPKQMLQKAIDLKAANGEITPSALNQLPEMVGGC